MPVWQWIAIAALVVIVVAVVIVAASVVRSRRQTGRLKQHYGHEYERLVTATGDSKVAEKELTARESKHDQLDIVTLTPWAFLEFSIRWQQVQAGFVDDPASAVAVADRLVNEVMRERGYAVDDFDQRVAGISVDHPQLVEQYRVAHGVHLSQQQGDVSIEQQRAAFMHYRTLFEALLGTATHNDASQEARA